MTATGQLLRGAPSVRPAGEGVLRGWNWIKDHYLAAVISLALLWVVGVPILSVINFSFRDGTPAAPGSLTLQNYRDAYGNPQTGPALLNTVIYAVAVSVVSLTLATLFAWLLERTDMPFRNVAWVLMILPIAMPGMLSSMAWILMLSKRIGVINIMIRNLLDVFGAHLTEGPFNIYSLHGMILVESLRGSSTLFLMMVAAFRVMDPALEEAASISGIRNSRVFRKVTLPLVTPALLAAGTYALMGNLDDLDTPLLLGVPAGVFLLPTLIWFTASQNSAWGLSSAYTTIFLVITLAMVVVYYRVVIRKAGNFAMITGKGYRPRRMRLGRWRFAALGVFLTYFLATIALPLGILVWASLLPSYEPPSVDALHRLTFSNYHELLHAPQIVSSIWNTVKLAVFTAFATMILAFLVAWLVVRQRVRGGLALDAISFLPHAIPSVAIGVALISFYLNPWTRWTQIYGTIAIMVLALMTRFMAFATRTANSSMTQLGNELEEAGYVSGVGKLRVLFRITFRLLSPAFVAGWIWIAAHSIKNLSVPLLLATPSNGTIATTLYFYWQRKADFSLASALGVALVAALALLAIFARRVISSGFSGQE
ncbi:MAG: iron(III) transport system permease protein [Actinomycetota bacterium]|nr:iron(III) transport system permease protein [Actinomycetota bacterium]